MKIENYQHFMNKWIYITLLSVLCAVSAMAQQTMWVRTGQVRYAFSTSQVGQMRYSEGGTKLTILDKTFNVSDIDSIYVKNQIFDLNTINVYYNGSSAQVDMSGNIAGKVSATVTGADVRVLQDTTVTEEIFYTLTGESDNGSFFQDGEMKITVNFKGLNLTSKTGPAIDIQDGKRIEINLLDSAENNLADAINKTHKACMYVKGHSEFKGNGTLNLTGNTKHAFGSDEYVELKKSFTGSLVVKEAEGDGFNINQFLEAKSGTILVERCEGDAIQVDAKKDTTKTNNGKAIFSGGIVKVLRSGDEERGLKVESDITITGGSVLEINSDFHAISSNGNILIDSAFVYVTSAVGNGFLTPGTITLVQGDIVAYGSNTTYGINASKGLIIKGGNLLAVGVANVYPHASCTQPSLVYMGKLPQAGTFALNNASGTNVAAFKLAKTLSSVKTMSVLLSTPGLLENNPFTFYSGATLDETKSNWHGFYTDGDAVTSNGTAINAGGTNITIPYTIIR